MEQHLSFDCFPALRFSDFRTLFQSVRPNCLQFAYLPSSDFSCPTITAVDRDDRPINCLSDYSLCFHVQRYHCSTVSSAMRWRLACGCLSSVIPDIENCMHVQCWLNSVLCKGTPSVLSNYFCQRLGQTKLGAKFVHSHRENNSFVLHSSCSYQDVI